MGTGVTTRVDLKKSMCLQLHMIRKLWRYQLVKYKGQISKQDAIWLRKIRNTMHIGPFIGRLFFFLSRRRVGELISGNLQNMRNVQTSVNHQ